MDQELEIQTTIDTITETLGAFSAEMAAIDKIAHKISRRTTRLIKTVLTILGISSMIILFLVVDLTDNMSKMIESMNTMYTHFGFMSKDMREITASVKNMGQNIDGIPVIAEAMKQMNFDVQGMNASVTGMDKNVQSMERNLVKIDGGVWEMSGRFISVTGAVDHMNYNVNQMSRPTDALSPFNFMIPR